MAFTDAAGAVPRQRGLIFKFQPELRPEGVVGHFKLFFDILADLAAAGFCAPQRAQAPDTLQAHPEAPGQPGEEVGPG
jgi:hypothetical protein